MCVMIMNEAGYISVTSVFNKLVCLLWFHSNESSCKPNCMRLTILTHLLHLFIYFFVDKSSQC